MAAENALDIDGVKREFEAGLDGDAVGRGGAGQDFDRADRDGLALGERGERCGGGPGEGGGQHLATVHWVFSRCIWWVSP